MAVTQEMPKRWGLDSCCSIHVTPDRSIFKTYRLLTDKDDCRPIGGIGGQLPPIGKGSIELKMNVDGQCRRLILDEVLYVPGLPMNLISKGKLMRTGCPMKIVPGGIKIGSRGITARLSFNDIFKFDMWEEPLTVDRKPSSKRTRKSAPPPASKPRPKRAFIATNPLDGPIPSPTPAKRPRSVSYESDTSISSATSCESDSDSSFGTARSAWS